MLKPENLSPALRVGLIVGALTASLLLLVGKHYYNYSRAQTVVLQTAPVDPRSLFQGDYVILNYDISRLDSKLLVSDGTTTAPARGRQGDSVYVALKDAGMIWADMKASFKPFTGLAADERMEERHLGKDQHWNVRWLFSWNSDEEAQLSSWKTIEGNHREVKAPEGTTYYVLQKHVGPVWQPVRVSTQPLQVEPGEVVLRGKASGEVWSADAGSFRVTYGIEAFFVPEGEGGWVERLGWGGERNRLLVRVKVAPNGTGYVDNLLLDNKPAFQSGGLNSWAADSPD